MVGSGRSRSPRRNRNIHQNAIELRVVHIMEEELQSRKIGDEEGKEN